MSRTLFSRFTPGAGTVGHAHNAATAKWRRGTARGLATGSQYIYRESAGKAAEGTELRKRKFFSGPVEGGKLCQGNYAYDGSAVPARCADLVEPAYAGDNAQKVDSVDFHLSLTDDASVRGMAEFGVVAFYDPRADADHQSQAYYAALRDARFVLHQRNADKLYAVCREAADSIAAGRDLVFNAQMQIQALCELLRAAADQGGQPYTQNFYAQERLLLLLDGDICRPAGGDSAAKRRIQELSSRMKFGIGYGLWRFDDAAGRPLLGGRDQFEAAADGRRPEDIQLGIMRDWLSAKWDAVMTQADKSAGNLSKSAQRLHAGQSKLSDQEKSEYRRVRGELSSYLRYVGEGVGDFDAQRTEALAAGREAYLPAATFRDEGRFHANWRLYDTSARGVTDTIAFLGALPFGRIHCAYYGQLAVASGLILADTDAGNYSTKPADESPGSLHVQGRKPHGGAQHYNPHLDERSPHVQLLMARALIRGDGVFSGEHLGSAGGDYYLQQFMLDNFEVYLSSKKAGEAREGDYAQPPVAPEHQRSSAEILLQHAADGASAGGESVSPGLPEAKSLLGRMRLGFGVAEELRDNLPKKRFPKQSTPSQRLYGDLFTNSGLSRMDRHIKRGIRALYDPGNTLKSIEDTRERALQDLWHAARDGDCRATAVLIHLNLQGSDKLGIKRDAAEAVRLIQTGMRQGMMYNPYFRSEMRKLSEQDSILFRFRGGSWSDVFSNTCSGISGRISVPQGTPMGRIYDVFHFAHQSTHWLRNTGLLIKAVRDCYRGKTDMGELRKAWGLNKRGEVDVRAAARKYAEERPGSFFRGMSEGEQNAYLAVEQRDRRAGYQKTLRLYEKGVHCIRMQMAYFSENPAADEIADSVGRRMFSSSGVRRKDLSARQYQRYNEMGKYLLPEAAQLRSMVEADQVKFQALADIERIDRDNDVADSVHMLRNKKLRKLANMYASRNDSHVELMAQGAKRGVMSSDNVKIKSEYLEKALHDVLDWNYILGNLRKVERPAGEPVTFASEIEDSVAALNGICTRKELVIEYFANGRPAGLTASSKVLPTEVPVPLSVSAALDRRLSLNGASSNGCFAAYTRNVNAEDADYIQQRLDFRSFTADPMDGPASLEGELEMFLAAGEGEKQAYIDNIEREILRGECLNMERLYVFIRYLSDDPQRAGRAPRGSRDSILKTRHRGFEVLFALNKFFSAPIFGNETDKSHGPQALLVLNPAKNGTTPYQGTTEQWYKAIQHEATLAADFMLLGYDLFKAGSIKAIVVPAVAGKADTAAAPLAGNERIPQTSLRRWVQIDTLVSAVPTGVRLNNLADGRGKMFCADRTMFDGDIYPPLPLRFQTGVREFSSVQFNLSTTSEHFLNCVRSYRNAPTYEGPFFADLWHFSKGLKRAALRNEPIGSEWIQSSLGNCGLDGHLFAMVAQAMLSAQVGTSPPYVIKLPYIPEPPPAWKISAAFGLLFFTNEGRSYFPEYEHVRAPLSQALLSLAVTPPYAVRKLVSARDAFAKNQTDMLAYQDIKDVSIDGEMIPHFSIHENFAPHNQLAEVFGNRRLDPLAEPAAYNNCYSNIFFSPLPEGLQRPLIAEDCHLLKTGNLDLYVDKSCMVDTAGGTVDLDWQMQVAHMCRTLGRPRIACRNNGDKILLTDLLYNLDKMGIDLRDLLWMTKFVLSTTKDYFPVEDRYLRNSEFFAISGSSSAHTCSHYFYSGLFAKNKEGGSYSVQQFSFLTQLAAYLAAWSGVDLATDRYRLSGHFGLALLSDHLLKRRPAISVGDLAAYKAENMVIVVNTADAVPSDGYSDIRVGSAVYPPAVGRNAHYLQVRSDVATGELSDLRTETFAGNLESRLFYGPEDNFRADALGPLEYPEVIPDDTQANHRVNFNRSFARLILLLDTVDGADEMNRIFHDAREGFTNRQTIFDRCFGAGGLGFSAVDLHHCERSIRRAAVPALAAGDIVLRLSPDIRNSWGDPLTPEQARAMYALANLMAEMSMDVSCGRLREGNITYPQRSFSEFVNASVREALNPAEPQIDETALPPTYQDATAEDPPGYDTLSQD